MCTAKASHIFSTKNNGVFEIFTFEILTKRLLTTSLVLNNRALLFINGPLFGSKNYFAKFFLPLTLNIPALKLPSFFFFFVKISSA